MGQGASAGKFGPFAGQFFVADYTLSFVRCAEMEKVNGEYQGATQQSRCVTDLELL